MLAPGTAMYGNHFALVAGLAVGLEDAGLEEAGCVGVCRDLEDFDLLGFPLDLLT